MAESIKSIFKPSNPQKYIGDPNMIICRSSWERHFCNWCDKNTDIVRWASEEFSIPYVSPKDNRVHRYYPDFLIEKTDGKRYIVEVKPKKQTIPPVKKEKVTKAYINESVMYAINQAKWKAAKEFALDNGVDFLVITEDELGIKQYARRKPKSGKSGSKPRSPRGRQSTKRKK